MLEDLERKLETFTKALATLNDILHEPYTIIVRDAAIQRFEYTFEAMWKLSQKYLKEKEGILAQSPKSVIRELFPLGIILEAETEILLDMVNKRNMSSHTYLEEIADTIFSKLEQYNQLMHKLQIKLAEQINGKRE